MTRQVGITADSYVLFAEKEDGSGYSIKMEIVDGMTKTEHISDDRQINYVLFNQVPAGVMVGLSEEANSIFTKDSIKRSRPADLEGNRFELQIVKGVQEQYCVALDDILSRPDEQGVIGDHAERQVRASLRVNRWHSSKADFTPRTVFLTYD